jgi:hypothetical protein
MQVRNDPAAEQPQIVAMLAQGPAGKLRLSKWRRNGQVLALLFGETMSAEVASGA